ncbi:MAG: DJ-1/PfpI family protein [Rhodospirillaceae bacterium]|nr:DJ-1/PfpI family protein [Rhodospirillaceae bacterium]MBT3492158.1 DJ-1/PfpI family protein [Rhodospirillaceae bacterium]MBT3778706.1 DJ-1/PfpI family protein [Rhodospirillaceae bacterium]MBT3975411.1 DJ-1/PfpI family protein [Rhodospirillaceae bacterium]MBT4169524.1 DJ-1/PfpI family protein [Rhodospirillaceae bacterium]
MGSVAMTTTFGILFFEGTEELDAIGPWEVFTMASKERDDIAVVSISEHGGTVTCNKGMRIVMDHSIADAPKLDVLLVPGGMGTRTEVDNPALLSWIAEVAKGCQWVTSVCTGSLLLAEAGPAAGKRITTHWGAIEMVRKRGKAGEVLENVRYVRDGNVVSSAGVSAGIDMSLWLIGEMYEPAFARKVQRNMEYDPAPPYSAEV